MHECGNLIQHEAKPEGCMRLPHEGIIIIHAYSTNSGGALIGLYPTVVTSTSVVSGFDH